MYGAVCTVCSVNLAQVYGPVADGTIEVHHLRELSQVGREYKVDPKDDLRPVCPNCHAVLHKRKPAYTIDEVRAFLAEHKKKR